VSGIKYFVDTNIIIYLLNGDKEIADILQGASLCISFITQLELLSFNHSIGEKRLIEAVIKESQVIDINEEIKDIVITIRLKHKIKLPDAIIIASSIYSHIPLITADSVFTKITDADVIFYSKR
jgi:predicted nucleic acid-binding protein